MRGEVIPKHPTQLYEALAYLTLFVILMILYFKYLDKLKKGTLFGLFLIGIFGSRFLIEFIKEVQVDFETTMSLNMGQWLSIPFVIAGVCFIIYGVAKNIPAKIQKG